MNEKRKRNIKQRSFIIAITLIGMICIASCRKEPPADNGKKQVAQTQTSAVENIQISGRVIDATSGKGLGGLSLSIYTTNSNEDMIRKQLTCADDGSFSFSVTKGSNCSISCYTMSAESYLFDTGWINKNHASGINLKKVAEDTTVEMKLKTRPSVVLIGTVKDSDASPRASASVFFTAYSQPTKTNKNGQFTIKAAPADKDYELLVITANSSMKKLAKIKAATTEIEITLEPSLSLTGQIIAEDNKPAAKLTFQLIPRVNDQAVYSIQSQCVTDEQGKFTAQNLCPDVTYSASWRAGSGINADYRNGTESFVATKDTSLNFKAERFIDEYNAPGNIAIGAETKCGKLTNFCLDANDNILACDGVNKHIKLIDPEDKLLATWKLNFRPEAIDNRTDGTTIVAGRGTVAILDKQGKVLKQADHPGSTASGIGFSGKDIFVAVRKGTGYAVYRMDENLENPKQIIKGLRGCCGQLDITAKDGIVYVAANTLFKVIKYDRDGKELASFGKKGRSGDDTFKGCCEPKNVCFDSAGNLYTSESEQCCVKKFTSDGKFLSPIGKVNGIRGCVRVSIAIDKNKTRMYMLDTTRNIIRKLDMPNLAKTN